MIVLDNNDSTLLHAAYSEDKMLGIVPKMANRHGLIAGATGTGKTVSLQVLAEGFSEMGVPVFLADIKGDLTGVANEGKSNKFYTRSEEAIKNILPDSNARFEFHGFPVEIFDIFGERGNALRTTPDEFGAVLLSRILGLNDTQYGVLNIAFRVAREKKIQLLDIADLRAMMLYIADNSKELSTIYGNVSAASVGAIQRALLQLEEQGGDKFFGEPHFDVMDFIKNKDNKGVINILAADKLGNSPLLYSTFLFWMLSSLYDKLPEVGDMDKPKFVFFFDEAHLLFNDTQKALLDKIEQIVRLIRSKGVGVYFITQSPGDIPENVLAQLGNKIQHALRAFTPKDQKTVKSVAQGFRENPNLNTEEALLQLETGEALISFLDEKGAPNIVERAKMLSPAGQIGPITDEERNSIVKGSVFANSMTQSSDWEKKFPQKASIVLGDETAKQDAEETRINAEKEAEKLAKEKEKEEKAREKELNKAIKEAEKRGKEEAKLEAKRKKEEAQAKKERQKLYSKIGNAIIRFLPKLMTFIFGKKK